MSSYATPKLENRIFSTLYYLSPTEEIHGDLTTSTTDCRDADVDSLEKAVLSEP